MVDARAKERISQETATGGMTPETLDFVAQTYIQTGQMPPLGMGKVAAEMRQKVLARAAQITTGGGASAADAAGTVATNKQDIAGKTATVKEFSTGVGARRVTAVNTALNHLETVDKLANDLGNSDIKVFNAASNALAKQLGVAAPASFDAAQAMVANEVIKAVVINGGGVKERQEAAETFARANSPEQLAGVTKTYKELLAGQLSTLEQQYETGSGRKDFRKKLSPAAVKLLTPSPAAPAAQAANPIDALLNKYK